MKNIMEQIELEVNTYTEDFIKRVINHFNKNEDNKVKIDEDDKGITLYKLGVSNTLSMVKEKLRKKL